MAGGLESALKITAKDETGGAFKALKAQVDAIDKQIAVFDKMAEAVGKIAPAADPLIKAIAESTKALEQQEAAAAAAAEGLGAIEGAAGAAAGGQERLRAAVMETSRVIAVQGAEAARVAEKIVQAQRRGGGGAREGRGGFWSEMRGLAPFAAPEGAHVWGEALGAGATIDNSLARLRASNLASPEDIAMARADYLDFSKTHTGVTEAEYIESFREALSNAPREESFHLAGQMATIKPALRNSGVSSTAEDDLATIRAMDELGFKTEAERDRYLEETTKMRQVFGDQIKMPTYLSAIQNAHAAAYDWSDEFKYRYLPTLLQMSGEQGGTQIATGYSNYVGQRMSQSELWALAHAGFVNSGDLIRNKVGDVRGVREGAQFFETDTFQKNIVQWALDFHRAYMSHNGASESGFSKLVARMPRNMGGLIEGIVHGEARFTRDAGLIGGAPRRAASSDTYGGQNPGAALEALRESVSQFGAVVAGPAVQAAAPAMMKLAQAITAISSAAGKFEEAHPGAGTAASAVATAGGGAAVLWGMWKMLTGVGKLLFGGGAGGAAAGGAAAAGGRGVLGRLLGGALVGGEEGSLGGPLGVVGGALVGAAATTLFEQQFKSRLAGGGGARSAGLRLGRDVHSPSIGPYAYYPPGPGSVSVSGAARIDQQLTVRIEPWPLLNAIVDEARQQSETTVPLLGGGSGRMDSDAAPNRARGIGHR